MQKLKPADGQIDSAATTLIKRGYSIKLISSETGISYFKLYRHIKGDGQLSEDESARLAHFNSISMERLNYGQYN